MFNCLGPPYESKDIRQLFRLISCRQTWNPLESLVEKIVFLDPAASCCWVRGRWKVQLAFDSLNAFYKLRLMKMKKHMLFTNSQKMRFTTGHVSLLVFFLPFFRGERGRRIVVAVPSRVSSEPKSSGCPRSWVGCTANPASRKSKKMFAVGCPGQADPL